MTNTKELETAEEQTINKYGASEKGKEQLWSQYEWKTVSDR